MKRNRKRGPLRLGTVAKSVFTCICIAGTGVGYVWQKNQIYRLGDEIKKRESVLSATEKRNTVLAAQIARLTSPQFLEARCQGLVSPRENQVVRLYEPGPEWDTRITLPVLPAQNPSGKTDKVMAKR